jgi:4-alpha-glucanotransferase
MGDAQAGAPREALVRVLPEGKPIRLATGSELRLEAGHCVRIHTRAPVVLPSGVHEWRSSPGKDEDWLIVTPMRCPAPPSARIWGWSAQLYAVRSRKSWGIGDFADLKSFLRWSRKEAGADFVLLNPLCAPLPLIPQLNSPYSPSSRLFLNPLYLRIEDVQSTHQLGSDLERLAAEGRALNDNRRIQRDAVLRLKLAALEKLWKEFAGDPRFDEFREEGGSVLRLYGTFCALAEKYRAGWPAWPKSFRQPDAPQVARFAAENEGRVLFHQWIQWLLDEQLARAARELPLMFDVPVGITPDGFDAWLWQDSLARDMRMGAPPDEYNTSGQDWGLTPFIPHRLRATGFLPWRLTLRAMLRHARGLRVDHVMGLFRLFWIPRDTSPAEGAFVRYPAEELLAVLAIEAQRAGAVVVGEDLGTVESGVRRAMRERRILSYRLLWFERTPPMGYPIGALAAVTTHDLFTIAGLWSGEDLSAQERLNLKPNAAGMERIRQRVARFAEVSPEAPVETVIPRLHAALSRAPSRLRTAALDDALAVKERPNMPGTIDEWPNWRLALPMTLEVLQRHPLPREVARAMRRTSK